MFILQVHTDHTESHIFTQLLLHPGFSSNHHFTPHFDPKMINALDISTNSCFKLHWQSPVAQIWNTQ